MEDIVDTEGEDYRNYTTVSKKAIAAAAATACSIKAVLDTPILTEDGELTVQSSEVQKQIEDLIYKKA